MYDTYINVMYDVLSKGRSANGSQWCCLALIGFNSSKRTHVGNVKQMLTLNNPSSQRAPNLSTLTDHFTPYGQCFYILHLRFLHFLSLTAQILLIVGGWDIAIESSIRAI